MIFVSVGSEKFPFDRLLKCMDSAVKDQAIDQPVFAQIGHSQYKPHSMDYRDFIAFQEMKDYIQKADIVVLHAGIGSTLLSLQLGKVPILFPRDASLKEHLDDHQMEFVKAMGSMNKTLVAYTADELIDKITHYEKYVEELKRNSDPSKKESSLTGYLNKIFVN